MKYLKVPLAAWLATRALVGITYLVLTVWSPQGDQVRLDEGLMAWDGGWYSSIARRGYHATGTDLRFAPLYPFFGRIAGFLLGGHPDTGLLVVSNMAALVALILIERYSALVNPDAPSDWAAFSMALWPAAFVLTFAYSEALFLALSVGLAYSIRTGRWWLAAALGLAAGATRPTGILLSILVVALIIEAKERLEARQSVAVVAPVAGLGIHLLVAKLSGAGFTAPADIQRPLRGGFVDPVSRLGTGVLDLMGRDPWGDGLHLPFAALGLVSVGLLWRRVGRPEAIYTAAIVMLALTAANWNSLERYLLSAFPLFLLAPTYAKRPGPQMALVVSAIGLVGMVSLAWLGLYVP